MYAGERSNYDKGVNTFSAEGRIFQIEYANKASKLFSSCVGIRCKEGVVLAVEKRVKAETCPLTLKMKKADRIPKRVLILEMMTI